MTIERPPLRVAPPPEFGAAAGPLGAPASALGLALLVAAMIALPQLPVWAREYDGVLVYLAFVLHTVLAGALFWWGIDTAAAHRARLARARRAVPESPR